MLELYKILAVILWEKQQGKQRFECKNCGILFSNNRPEQKIKNCFIWFNKWILERQTYKTLCRDSGYSKDTLQRTFYKILEPTPVLKIIKRECVNLRTDAIYLAQFCLVAYQDDYDGYTQLIRFTDGENIMRKLKKI